MSISNEKILKIFSKNSLSKKLLAYILICSTVLALTITVIHLLWDYHQDIDLIEENMKQIEVSIVPSLTKSLWDLNYEQTETQISSLVKLANIEYVRIIQIDDNKQTKLMEKGKFREKFDFSQQFNLIIDEKVIGSLFVASSLDKVYQRLIEKSMILLITQSVKTFIVSLFILFIIFHIVIRHLNHIVHNIKHLDINNSNTQLTLQRRKNKNSNFDELDILVDTYNTMRDKINAELSAKKKANNELKTERDFSNTIIKSSTSVICCLDEDFIVSTMNPAGALLVGECKSVKIQKQWIDLFVEQNLHKEIAKQLNANTTIENLEITMLNQQQKKCTLLWTFTPTYQDNNKTYLAFGYDVSLLKANEQEVKELNEQLETKVKSRTNSLQTSNQQLKLAYKNLKATQNSLIESEKMASLGGLVAGVAHEINTPLGTSILALSYLDSEIKELSTRMDNGTISKKFINELLTNLSKSIVLLESNLQRSADLVRDFKQVAVDQSSETYCEFDVGQNINQIVSSLHHELKKAQCKVNVVCQSELKIKSFPGCFTQIYTNLILNSLIHGFNNWQGVKEITISVRKDDHRLYLEYKDTGKGISDSIKDSIFEPFVTTNRGQGGSGLGTHIVYNIVVQLLKGKITCNTDVTKGACFLISFPITVD